MEPIEVWVGGETAPVRGVEIDSDEADYKERYAVPYLHVQFEGSMTTTRIHISEAKYDGGAKALIETLYERGLVPGWYAKGEDRPPE